MTPRLSVKIIAVALGLGLTCALAEFATRAFFAWQVGPRVLVYGTEWFRNIDAREREKRQGLSEAAKKEIATEWARTDSVENHSLKLVGYSKFFPNEIKTTRNPDTGARIAVNINSRGFRGREFSDQKAPGTVRVLTLGSSSTFGYYNADHETYPYLLEERLNKACDRGVRFEVINFAIPHASSANIAAMFAAEGVPLRPDVVTFYEGRNDSTLNRRPEGVAAKLYSVLVHRLLLVAFVDQLVVGERVSATDALRKVDPQAADVSQVFFRNLAAILDTARGAGIKLIVANQQATSRTPVPGVGPDYATLKGVTYAQEAAEIRRRMERNSDVSTYEYSFLIHERLMKDLEQWSQRQGVPFVDVVGALDQDRHYMLSWVHLHPEANRVVAAKLSEAILREFCVPEMARREARPVPVAR
jgi:lysophospholipase L1-like esterase